MPDTWTEGKWFFHKAAMRSRAAYCDFFLFHGVVPCLRWLKELSREALFLSKTFSLAAAKEAAKLLGLLRVTVVAEHSICLAMCLFLQEMFLASSSLLPATSLAHVQCSMSIQSISGFSKSARLFLQSLAASLRMFLTLKALKTAEPV